MINKIIRFSIDNKLIIFLFLLGLLGFGIFSFNKLPIDAVPDISDNQVQIVTVSPTLAAEEIERFITYPVEISMATIPGVTQIRSVSRFGLSDITVVFEDGISVLAARQMAAERLKNAESMIPPGMGSPEMLPVTTGLSEIYQYIIRPKSGYENKYSAMELRTIQDWNIKRQLLGISGVAEVSSFGGYTKQYEISVNPERLRSMKITLSDIFDVLEKNNQNTGGAYIDKKPNAYFIRGLGLISNIEDIEEIVVKNDNGVPVLLGNIADVKYGYANRYGALTVDNKGEGVGGIVLMLKGQNAAKVVEDVKERIEQIRKTLPEGIEIEPFIDRTRLVDNAIHTVSKNLIEGALIVIFVLVIFLGNLRAGLIVASVIPLAMLFTISMMYIFGVSGNLMSLGAIDFGLIVDGAVIIVESVMHSITRMNPAITGGDRLSAGQMNEEVYGSSSKMMNSAAFGQIIILIVYLPILALVGIEGKMFGPMAQTVSFAILGALILSVTYIPMMSSVFLSRKIQHKKNISDKIMDFLQKVYSPIIKGALNRRGLVVGISVVLLVITVVVFTRMGGEFIPTLEEGDFAVETRLMPGSSLTQTVETTLKASDILLKKFPEVKKTVGKIGTSEIPSDPMPIEACDLMVILKDKDEWVSATSREELADKMKEALQEIPGVEFGFLQPIQMRFNELMTGAKQDLAIKIFGEDMPTLAEKANEVAGIIKKIQGVSDIYVEAVTGLPQIVIAPKRKKIAEYGLNIETVNNVVKTAFAGAAAGQVFEGEKRFDLVVRLDEKFRKDIADVKSLYVPLPNGNQVPITEVADIRYSEGPMQISREETKRRIVIGANVRDRDVESLVEEIKQELDKGLKLPPGYFVTYGGQFENMVDAKERLSVAVPVALVLILILLFFTFGSFKQALLIFSAIPFSAIGGVFALILRDMPFSISAGVGFIALFGVAVLNGIVLIGYFNQLKKGGVSDLRERILKGTKGRLRPVIMTAAVASMGFLPMALSGSSGAEVQKPLATVVIGGLISATLLTLIVLPVLYSLFDQNNIKNEKMESNNIARLNGGPSTLSVLLLVVLGFSGLNSYAQTPELRFVTQEEAIKEALQNNPAVQTGFYEIQSREAFEKTASELPKTNLSTIYGQYNSLYNDNYININQDFAFPTVYGARKQLLESQTKEAEVRLKVTENELKKKVRLAYNQLLYLLEKKKLLLYQDSLFSKFFEASKLRFEAGETGYLEKVTAEAQYMEIKSDLTQNISDIQIYTKELQVLMNSKDSIVVTGEFKKQLSPELADTSSIAENPFLILQKNKVGISKAATRYEKSLRLPDFNIGFFTQTLTGYQTVNGVDQFYGLSKRFTGVIGGISIPIWYRPYAAKVKASKLNEKTEQSRLEEQAKHLSGQYAIQSEQYKKALNKVQYYETTALPQADLIINNATKAFYAGYAGYVEYLLGINSALALKSSYLNYLNLYNQSIINLYYLNGK